MDKSTDIPPAWEKIDLQQLSGIIMVVGAPDVGKSTFARFLYQRLCTVSPRLAYLDGDPGQSTLGLPSTMTLALAAPEDDTFPPQGQSWRTFVGSVSPKGHMLSVVTGAARLVEAARNTDAQVIIYDTTGLVDPTRGGAYLKLAKIDLLRPTVLFAIQRDRELEPLLMPLRRSRRVHVVELPSSPAAQRRDISFRKEHRTKKFALYFANARPLRIRWTQFAVFPAPRFYLNRLVAMEDADGFTIGLGIVDQIDRESREVIFHTPIASVNSVDAIRLGDVAVDPQTFDDRHLTCTLMKSSNNT